jgi:hypothetical protein
MGNHWGIKHGGVFVVAMLFLGAFAELRKRLLALPCLSACLPACLSV